MPNTLKEETPVVSEAPRVTEPSVPAMEYALPEIDVARPTVKVWGCGGCGINQVNNYLETYKRMWGPQVVFDFVDASAANMTEGNITGTRISTSGSGKVRAENVDAAKQYAASIYADTEPEDIHLIIFSLAGGSGSVIAPYLIKELKDVHGKAVIAIGITNSMRQHDARNTMMSLKTLDNVANGLGLYIPTMLFTNNLDGSNEEIVDSKCIQRIDLLLKLLVSEAREIDRNDRINFFNPDKTIDAPAGVYTFNVFEGIEADDINTGECPVVKETIYDSLLVLAANEKRSIVRNGDSIYDTRIAFYGYCAEGHNVTASCITAIMGGPISDKVINDVSAVVKRYENIDRTAGRIQMKSSSKNAEVTSADDLISL